MTVVVTVDGSQVPFTMCDTCMHVWHMCMRYLLDAVQLHQVVRKLHVRNHVINTIRCQIITP